MCVLKRQHDQWFLQPLVRLLLLLRYKTPLEAALYLSAWLCTYPEVDSHSACAPSGQRVANKLAPN